MNSSRVCIRMCWSYDSFAMCTAFASPFSLAQPQMNSSLSTVPLPSMSSSLKRVHTPSDSMPRLARYAKDLSSSSLTSSSSSVMTPDPSESISSKRLRIWSRKLSLFAISSAVAKSLSFCALSTALWQKTPVTTFSIAKTLTTMKIQKSITQNPPTSLRGSTTSCQLMPPAIAIKSVNMDLGNVPQKNFSLPGMPCGISSATPLSRWSLVACVKAMPKP
mmetsp:Transcript_50/g.100  ORF Transcript_50/g.100 Transcript_50/m.100 type:complete len:219 (-) Transcript_50:140-796(-)